MDDGSMSADEYLRRAAELNEKQETLQREQAVLDAHMKRIEAAGVIDMHRLLDHFYRVTHPTKQPGPGYEVAYVSAPDGNPAQIKIEEVPYLGDVDISIRNVHNLPTRPRFRPAALQPVGDCGPTDAMREQMNTGEYPTLDDHAKRRSPAFEPLMDDMGRFSTKRLTKEEEDAIRNRTGSRAVRNST